MIGDQGATALAEALALNQGVVDELWLSNNSIGSAGAEAIAAALTDNSGYQKMHNAREFVF